MFNMADTIIFDENCKHDWKHKECYVDGMSVVAKWDICTKCRSEKNRKVKGIDF